MKHILITITLFLTLTSYSQKGKVIYTATFSFDSFYKSKGESDSNESDKDYIENTEDIECELTFNKNESYFKKNDKIVVKKSKFNITNIKVGRGEFYHNRKDNETIEMYEFFGEDFLITKNKIIWEFENETKTISGYLCKKAVTVLKLSGRNGIIERKVIAWYAPKIPISFGPKNYNGLPGLIISLQEGDFFYIATKIILNTTKDILITKPTNGKNMTQNEFDIIIADFNRNRKKYMKRLK
ncbi:MAG: GLPGLI family protein [Flavobacteriaceae bacterium]